MMRMKKITYKLLLILCLAFFLVTLLSSAAIAEDMPGMDHEDSANEAAENAPAPGSPGYEPIVEPADDSSMAVIAVSFFLVPVFGWLIIRSVRKNKKKT